MNSVSGFFARLAEARYKLPQRWQQVCHKLGADRIVATEYLENGDCVVTVTFLGVQTGRHVNKCKADKVGDGFLFFTKDDLDKSDPTWRKWAQARNRATYKEYEKWCKARNWQPRTLAESIAP